MGVVAGGEAAAGHEQPVEVRRQEAAVRDVVGTGEELPAGVATPRVLLDRRGAAGDGVVEAGAADHVVAFEPVATADAPALADPDAARHPRHARRAEPGHAVLKETGVLDRLGAPLALGNRQRLGLARIAVRHARHVDELHARDRRGVRRTLAARQVVAAAVHGIGQGLQHRRPPEGEVSGAVDRRQRESRGHRLRVGDVAEALRRRTGEVRQYRVTRTVDRGAHVDFDQLCTRSEQHADRPPVVDSDIGERRVQQHADPGLGAHLVVEPAQGLGVVGHARAGAVGVGSQERGVGRLQPSHDHSGQSVDHPLAAFPGRPEAIEGVEHAGAGAAQRAFAFDQRHRCTVAGRGHRRHDPRDPAPSTTTSARRRWVG